jgi:hypothetical protein
MKIAFQIFFLITVIQGCNTNLDSKQLIEKFYQNKSDLNFLINSIKGDKILDSVLGEKLNGNLLKLKTSNPGQYDLCKKLGITELSSHKSISKNSPRWYYIKTDWKSEYPIFLIYGYVEYHLADSIIKDKSEVKINIDSSGKIKGFYKKDDNNNETWCLGDNWKMFRLVKEIQVKQ